MIRWTPPSTPWRPGSCPAVLGAAILRIAASLGRLAMAVNLRDNLGNLDARNITLVTDAITAANG